MNVNKALDAIAGLRNIEDVRDYAEHLGVHPDYVLPDNMFKNAIDVEGAATQLGYYTSDYMCTRTEQMLWNKEVDFFQMIKEAESIKKSPFDRETIERASIEFNETGDADYLDDIMDWLEDVWCSSNYFKLIDDSICQCSDAEYDKICRKITGNNGELTQALEMAKARLYEHIVDCDKRASSIDVFWGDLFPRCLATNNYGSWSGLPARTTIYREVLTTTEYLRIIQRYVTLRFGATSEEVSRLRLGTGRGHNRCCFEYVGEKGGKQFIVQQGLCDYKTCRESNVPLWFLFLPISVLEEHVKKGLEYVDEQMKEDNSIWDASLNWTYLQTGLLTSDYLYQVTPAQEWEGLTWRTLKYLEFVEKRDHISENAIRKMQTIADAATISEFFEYIADYFPDIEDDLRTDSRLVSQEEILLNLMDGSLSFAELVHEFSSILPHKFENNSLNRLTKWYEKVYESAEGDDSKSDKEVHQEDDLADTDLEALLAQVCNYLYEACCTSNWFIWQERKGTYKNVKEDDARVLSKLKNSLPDVTTSSFTCSLSQDEILGFRMLWPCHYERYTIPHWDRFPRNYFTIYNDCIAQTDYLWLTRKLLVNRYGFSEAEASKICLLPALDEDALELAIKRETPGGDFRYIRGSNFEFWANTWVSLRANEPTLEELMPKNAFEPHVREGGEALENDIEDWGRWDCSLAWIHIEGTSPDRVYQVLKKSGMGQRSMSMRLSMIANSTRLARP